MYFKKLDIVGFKSFAEHTKLYFEPGITAVVGPNGCGKSNIIDAIKWVLGEQSVKSLRGSTMEDVIFNGTDDREPINMAEVSLTLSNVDRILPIDVDEVVVSRRLFRSGESEYLINKAPVRLKDVSELFMGTGIGAEAYSIIEQGKIDLIISSRPEDRRFIFEEASGITKYKSKKREAIRKLEDTDNNLLRVNDIIVEVKRQIDSITRQARKAERYKERFDRLKELESKLAFYEYDLLKKERTDIECDMSKVREEVSRMSREIESLTAHLEAERLSLAGIDVKFTELQNAKFSKESLTEQNKSKIVVDKERIAELSARIENLDSEIVSIEARKDSSEKLVQELENEFATISDAEEAKKRVLIEEEKRLSELEREIKQSEKNIEESRQKIVGYMAERSKSKNEIIRITSDIQNRSVRLRRLGIEMESAAGDARAVREKLSGVSAEFKESENRLNSILAEKDRLLKERDGLSASIKAAEGDLQKERSILITLESKKSFLEDLIKRHEGFTGGTKSLLESLEKGEVNIDGIEGVLGNMVEVDRDFGAAVEAALGDYVQCIVSKDRQSALRAAEYMRVNKKGQATFLISDEIDASGDMNPAPLPADGIIGRLSDFVAVKDSLRKITENLLRNTYLVENMEKAENILNNIPRDASSPARLVTKKGEILSRGFVMAGSETFSEDAGIIGRQLRLRETVSEIETAVNVIARMEEARSGLSAGLISIEEKLSGIEGMLKDQEAEYHNKKSQLSSVEHEDARLGEEMALLKLESDEINEEVGELTLRKNEFEKKLSEMEKDEYDAQNVLTGSEESIRNLAREREEIMVLMAKVKAELQALSKERATLSQNIEVQKEAFQTYASSLTQKKEETEASRRKTDELIQEIEELGTEVAELTVEVRVISEEVVRIGAGKERNASVIDETEK